MTKTSAPSASAPRLCPTCGTRVGAAATKCLVCGADLTLKAGGRGGRTKVMPVGGAGLRLPNPAVLILLLLLVVLGVAGFMFATGRIKLPSVTTVVEVPTATTTVTLTPPPTFTQPATATETAAP